MAKKVIDQIKQDILSGICWQFMLIGVHASLSRLFTLASHIDLTGWIFANQYNSQPGCYRVLLLENRNLSGYFTPEFRRKGFAVNYCAQCALLPKSFKSHAVSKVF